MMQFSPSWHCPGVATVREKYRTVLYTDLASHLLNGSEVRRRSWAPGRSVVLSEAPNDARRVDVLDHILRALLSLTLLTPQGSHHYASHSIDRRADDWEVIDGKKLTRA